MSGLDSVGSRRGAVWRHVRWRTVLSALAGGGLTVAGLGGPLAGGALGAEAPAGSTTTGEGAEPPVTSTTPESGTSTTGSGASTTSTSTTPATTTTPSTSTSTSTSTTAGPSAPAPVLAPAPAAGEAPAVVVRHKQQTTPGRRASPGNLTQTKAKPAGGGSSTNGNTSTPGGANATAGAPNNVALPPQLIAGQAAALAAMLDGSAASAQALDFYRVPLFLLPIYRAAAIQYDVPWPILAAINEIETDYGTDLSVSSAGAEGWMQFEPATWLQYGVDALNAGYADPYNPVDAIFAAARYLNAAGAAHSLSAAILAYNHSEAYVSSVLLRAKLIAAYPDQVIATLTGLVDGRPPVTGKRIGWGQAPSSPAAGATPLPSPSSATAGASAVSPSPSGAGASTPGSTVASSASATASGSSAATTPGSSAAPAPASAASSATAKATTLQLVDVTSEPNAHAVAVGGGRIVKLGRSRKLGSYVVLQDVYGDVFTYAGLASIARSYTPAQAQSAANAAAQRTASASTQTGSGSSGAPAAGSTPAGTGKVRVFAHPGNPDARAAFRMRSVVERAAAGGRLPLRSGSIVTEGTVLGRVATPPGARDGHLRFAIRPAGDASTIDPRAILSNWAQLDAALHPQGARGNPNLLGATASDVFLLSKSRLEHEVLADPGIGLSACSRREVASGAIDERALAVLAFLSRSGLKPTVGTLRCGSYDASGYVARGHSGDAVAIVAINGVPIAGHQGAGSITDTTIRTLLTLQGQFVPARIASLMHYPGAPTTLARADHGDYVELVFVPAPIHPRAVTARAGAAHAAGAGKTAPAQAAIAGELSPAQWEQLVSRIAALPTPAVAVKPSSAAIPDHSASTSSPQTASSNHGLGSGSSSGGSSSGG